MGPEARCTNNVCRCRDGTSFLGSRCYTPIPLTGRCNFSQECVLRNEFTYCQPGLELYTCIEAAFQFEQSCHEKIFIGGRCLADIQCQLSIEGLSHCDVKTSTCQCTISKHKFLDICSGGVTYFSNMLLFLGLVLTSCLDILQY